jgi:hypothetical protein
MQDTFSNNNNNFIYIQDTDVDGEQFPTPAAPTVSRSSVLPPPPKKQRVLGQVAEENGFYRKIFCM